MSTTEMREKIIDYVEHADDQMLQAIYKIVEASDYSYTLTDEQMSIVEGRVEEYLAGKSITYDWEEAKNMIGKKP